MPERWRPFHAVPFLSVFLPHNPCNTRFIIYCRVPARWGLQYIGQPIRISEPYVKRFGRESSNGQTDTPDRFYTLHLLMREGKNCDTICMLCRKHGKGHNHLLQFCLANFTNRTESLKRASQEIANSYQFHHFLRSIQILLRMYGIDTAGVPESHDACVFHRLYHYRMRSYFLCHI